VGPDQIAVHTADGVRLAGIHVTQVTTDTAVVLAHGFSGSVSKPAVRAIVNQLATHAGVLAFDFRGHGRSAGRSTLGDREILDVDAVVTHARALGYRHVVTLGFSMGASAVLRHAALHGGVDAVGAVSGTSRWFYRDTAPMRRLHWVVERRLGRIIARHALRTRVSAAGWDPLPESPVEVVARIAPVPLLIVHGDQDNFFPVDHAEALAAAAGDPVELWIVPGFGHAEAAVTPELVDRIATHLLAVAAGVA
jgi:pimeloyl-ACP methyl ester carboxylesterase